MSDIHGWAMLLIHLGYACIFAYGVFLANHWLGYLAFIGMYGPIAAIVLWVYFGPKPELPNPPEKDTHP